MAVYDPTRALTVPGRLILNPTQSGINTGTYPYAGTALGIVSKAKLVREQTYAFGNSEARGRDAVSVYGGRYKASLTFVLTQYDTAVLDSVWAYSTSTGSGVTAYSYPTPNILTLPKAGQTTLSPGLIAATSPLLFAADDPVNPSVLVLNPFWILPAKLELDLTLKDPLETSIVVVAGIDANGSDIRVDLLQNLSLT